MLVNKTVEFFLSEVVRRTGCRRARSEMPAARNRVAAGRDGSGQMLGRGRCRRGPRLVWQRNLQGSGRRQARSEMPAGAETGTGRDADDQITGTGAGTGARFRRPNHRGRRQENQLKRKRSIISSSNSGFSKSFSLVMIKVLCSQNPASW